MRTSPHQPHPRGTNAPCALSYYYGGSAGVISGLIDHSAHHSDKGQEDRPPENGGCLALAERRRPSSIQMACRVRETSRRGCLACASGTRWHHGPNSSPGHSSRSPCPAAGRTSRASPPAHAALRLFFSSDADLLEAAAWLHDVGYALHLGATGVHQLDGARYLRDAKRAGTMLCRLVAYHSCAIIEAGERGLAEVLGLEFESAPQELSSTLTYCDMTTSPDGKPVPVEQRPPRHMIATAG